MRVGYTGAMQRGPDDERGSEPRGALDWREQAFTFNDAAAFLSRPFFVPARLLLSLFFVAVCAFPKKKGNLFLLLLSLQDSTYFKYRHVLQWALK